MWRACERFGILPPEIKSDWDENPPWNQASLLAYEQLRQHEEVKESEMAGAGVLAAMFSVKR